MRVLVVDNVTFMRLRLREMLESAGNEVVGEALDRKDAIAKFASLNPDLVTMDLMFPSTDGIVTTKIIRSMDPQAKILIISSVAEKAIVKAAIQSGAYDYIIKPVDEIRLIRAVDKASVPVQSV